MIDLVVLKLGASPKEPLAWGAFSGATIAEAGRVADVAALAAVVAGVPPEARLVAVLPGEQTAMRAIPSPPKNPAKLKAAAAFLLEDELAEPVDDLHIAISTTPRRSALAISKSVLREWLAAFEAAGVSVSEMIPDYLCIGGSETACIFVGDRDRIVGAQAGAGFAAERALAERIGPAFIAAAGEAAVIAYGCGDAVARWTPGPVERRPLPHEADVLALYGAHLALKGAAANFLSGEFRRKKPRAFKLGEWRRVAALAAGFAATAIAAGIAGGVRDGRIAAQFETSARSLHAAAFPTFAGGDIGAHSRAILTEGVKTASFLEMTAMLDRALEPHEGIAIDRLRYDAARGLFAFTIRSNSDAGIEAFRAALDAQGLIAADSGGYRRSGEAWIGEMSARAK